MSDHSADMLEIFSSIQGEGLLVGLRQIFLRFCSCNLHCHYCDTESASPEHCSIEETPGRRDPVQVENPVALDQIVALIDKWQRGWPGVHHSISITGGEPLLHHETLSEWLPVLRSRLPIYLETNGMLHSTLASLIEHFDHISMDIKLPSTSGHTELWESHREFLRIAVRQNALVKTVINDMTEEWEIIRTCEIISSIDKNVPLILQPVTLKDGKVGLTPIKVLEMQETAASYLSEVRVIPQTHHLLGLL